MTNVVMSLGDRALGKPEVSVVMSMFTLLVCRPHRSTGQGKLLSLALARFLLDVSSVLEFVELLLLTPFGCLDLLAGQWASSVIDT